MVQHHRTTQDGGDGVCLAGTDDVRRRAMDRLEHRHAIRVQVGGGSQADTAGHRTTEVGEDVAEQVVGDDHVVTLGVLHEVDAGGVDMVVRRLDLGVLGSDFVEGAFPEIAREGEDVGLVHEGDVLAALYREVEGVADAAFDTHAGVDRTLGGDLVRGVGPKQAALSGVGALRIFPDDDKVVADNTVVGARTEERPVVDVKVKFETHLEQQASLNKTGWHIGGADGAGVEGIDPTPLIDDFLGQDGAILQVSLAAEVVVNGLVLDAECVDDLEAFGHDLGADAVATHDADAVRHVGTFLEQEKPPTEVDGWRRTPKARRALRNADDDQGCHHGCQPTGRPCSTQSPVDVTCGLYG